jgi:uncharacterized membrane protein YhaH (DUF805 family)
MRKGNFPLGIKEIFDPKGRIDRVTLFLYDLGLGLIGSAGLFLIRAGASIAQAKTSLDLFPYQAGVTLVFCLIVVYAMFCVDAKRLHDLNVTAFLILIPFAANFLHVVLPILERHPTELPFTLPTAITDNQATIDIVLGGIQLIFALVLLFVPGTRGPNRYGARYSDEAPPKARILEG